MRSDRTCLRTALTGVCAAAILAGALWAQAGLTVDQLCQFVQSSIQLKHPDKQVASYLLKLKLSQRLNARTIEELQGLGAGPATMEALRRLVESASGLPEPAAKPVKPPPPPIPPQSAAEQKALLDRVREYALNYSKSLPNFICTQVTRRYEDRTGQGFWVANDTLTTRLTYFEQKETYKLVMINNHSTDLNYHALGGASSSGEFGSMLHEIFDPESETSFEWLRWGTLRGKLTHVYKYSVPQATSKWRLSYERTHEITAGYTGLIYVDRDSEMILKVTQEGENIPPTFPIQQASDALDYDFVKIGEQTFLLPLKAEVRMRHDKALTKNVVEFHLYHKFGAEAEIKFDTPEPIPEDKTKEK